MQQRAASHASMYKGRWGRYRLNFLRANPFCVRCAQRGISSAAQVVDHIVPHDGDASRFWDSLNHQALCKWCHDTKTASQDGGFGNPVKRRAA